jgi:hypothetical protein
MVAELHDSDLMTCVLDWKTGSLEVNIRAWEGEVKIVASNLKNVHLPRLQEWGPSTMINFIEGPTLQEDGFSIMRINLQSGDVIEIVAGSFAGHDSYKSTYPRPDQLGIKL